MLGLPPRLEDADVARLAHELARSVAPFGPSAVIYLHRGGAPVGRTMAAALDVPCFRLDVRYPATALLRRLPRPVEVLAFPLKELAYRLTAPRAVDGSDAAWPAPTERVVLVDDSASSGRTVRAALAALARRGFPRERISVAVIRCGAGARDVVDHFALSAPVRFPGLG